MKSDIKTLGSQVSNRDDFERKVLTAPMKVSEGVDFFHIPLRIQLVDLFCNPAIRLLFQFQFLRIGRPRGLAGSPSTQHYGSYSALGFLRHYRQLHPGLSITTNPGWVGLKGWVSWIWFGNGFLDTHI